MNKQIEKITYKNFLEKVRGTGKGRVSMGRMITVGYNGSLEEEMQRVLS